MPVLKIATLKHKLGLNDPPGSFDTMRAKRQLRATALSVAGFTNSAKKLTSVRYCYEHKMACIGSQFTKWSVHKNRRNAVNPSTKQSTSRLDFADKEQLFLLVIWWASSTKDRTSPTSLNKKRSKTVEINRYTKVRPCEHQGNGMSLGVIVGAAAFKWKLLIKLLVFYLFSLSISRNYIVPGQMAYKVSQILQRNINFLKCHFLLIFL